MTLLLVFMGVVVFFASQQGKGGIFDLRNRASTGAGSTTLTLAPPDSTKRYVGDEFPVDLIFNANNRAISGIAFRLTFPDTGVVTVIDQDATKTGAQIKSFSSALDASFTDSVNQSSPQPTGSVYIDFATITTLPDGYTNSSGQKLASIIFKANKEGSVTIQHDPDRSIVNEKVQSGTIRDILQTVTDYAIHVEKDTEPPVPTIAGDFGQTNTSSTDSTVTFSWTGIDMPSRQAGVIVPLTYSYQFDSTAWSPFAPATTITKTLLNGNHVFRVRAKDPSGNISTPVEPASLRNFSLDLKPTLTSRTPDGGQTGTEVTLIGTNFGATRGTAVVKFGTKAAASTDYKSWSNTQIVVKVPAGANGNITVVRGTLVSNPLPFTLGTMIKVVFNFEAITQDAGTKNVELKIRRGTAVPENFSTIPATWSAADNAYTATVGPLATPFTTASNYVVSIKGGSSLRKTFPNITLTNNVYNVVKRVAAADTLKIADFNNDNVLNVTDVGELLGKYRQSTIPATGDYAPFDLNGDGVFDIVDVGLLLSKYTKLETPGDNP